MIAASATSNAPWITYAVLNPLSPMMMGVPSVLAPTVEVQTNDHLNGIATTEDAVRSQLFKDFVIQRL